MPKKTPAATENFEKSISELEQIVKRMDTGELSLEEALGLFERGVVLSRECQQLLKNAEQKVHLLIEKNGTLSETPFTAGDE